MAQTALSQAAFTAGCGMPEKLVGREGVALLLPTQRQEGR